MHALRRSATVVAFLTCALSSQALTTYTWTGTAGGNSLDTAGNWSSAPTFDATAELMFLNLPATGTTLTLDGSKTIGKLSVSYAASPQDYAMTIAAGTPTSGALTVGDLAVALSTANGQRGNVNLNVPVTVPVAGGTWTISGQVSGGGSTQRCNLNSTLTALGPLNIFGTGNAQGAFFVNGAATLASLTRGTKSAVTFNGTTTISGNLTLNGDPGSCFTTFAADDTMIGGNVVFTSNSSSLSFNGSRTTVTGTLNGLQSGCTINFYGGNNTFGGAVTENCNNGILYFHGGTNTFAVSPITYSLGNLGAGGEGAWGTASIAYTLGVPLLFSGHHTVTNLIACTGTGTALIMKPNSGVVTFAGPLTGFAAAKGFTVSGADGVLVFNPTSGLNGNAITVTGGALSSASTGLAGNILINGLVGVLLLDNLSWNAWNAARPYGVAAGQWQHTAGGFAARGTAPC